MSSALLDIGAPIQNPILHINIINGQLSHFLSASSHFFPTSDKSQSKQHTTMNPSNFGNLNSGFSYSTQNSNQNPDLSSRSSSSSTKGGLSRPRFVKVRRQSNPHNPFKSKEETCIGSGFNPFRPVTSPVEQGGSGSSEFGSGSGSVGNDAFVFGASKSSMGFNSNSGEGIIEDLKSLRIGSGNVNDKSGFVFQSDGSMKRLSIDDKEKVGDGGSKLSANVGFGSGVNVASSTGRNVESMLPDELRKKFNIGEAGGVTDGGGSFGASEINKFEFESGEKGSYMFATATENILSDQIKNLNIKGPLDTNNVNKKTNKNNNFTFGSKEGAGSGYAGGENESTCPHEMGCRLNNGSANGETSCQTDMGFFSSQIFEKDLPTLNKGDAKFHDCSDTIPAKFVFKGGMQGNDVSGIQVPTDQPKVDEQPIGVAGPSHAFSSSLAGGIAHGAPLAGGVDKTDGFGFTSKQDAVRSPFVEFRTPSTKGNLFTSINTKKEFSSKFKDSNVKKKRGKLKQSIKVPLYSGQDFVTRENVSHEIPEASESYSPMDVSPYQETSSDARNSRETSVASEESFTFDNQHASKDSQPAVMNDAIDEDLIIATQQMDINEEYAKCGETKEENFECYSDKGIGAENHPEDSISGAETESFKSANEEIDSISDVMVASAESEASSSTHLDSDLRTQFFSAVSSEDTVSPGSTFASTARLSAKHSQKKKNLARADNDSLNSSADSKGSHAPSSLQYNLFSGASSHLSPVWSKKVGLSTPSHVVGDNAVVLRGQGINQGSESASVTAQEACEKWRLRGNQAYTSGNLSEAEDCYTQGVNCVSKGEASKSCLRALTLCYSNRAATRMSLGRMRDALGDCKMAAEIDPNFLKVQVRAANCYLSLGEVEDAVQYFKRCLQLGSDVCVDRKIAVEASDGLLKAQKVSECMQNSAELLKWRAPDEAESALQVIPEGLSISPHSEKLLEMKAESLFMLRKYEEVIQLCEQTFDSAKKNSPPLHADYHVENLDPELTKYTSFMIWRCHLIFKSYFHLGRLEEAIGSLEKQGELTSASKSFYSTLSGNGSKKLESLVSLAATVRELLRHKAAGNEAFQAGKHSEAIEYYSAALSRNAESRPFAAICFCNRAAAYKALGQITDAIADCNLAIALDGNYLKAISRRATLYEMIRDYGHAADDLQRLVAVLTKQVQEKNNQVGQSDRTTNLANDLRQARLLLSTVEEEARKEIPLNMYLILGIEPAASSSEVKKAYRKAALRHHPDKAGQSLARNDNADDSLWKEIGEEVYKDADRLFKMIGEAYAVLSDPAKRSQFDMEEAMRNDPKKRSGSSTYRTNTDSQNYPFERSRSRREWRDMQSYGQYNHQ